jgi:hypothetical protein
MSYTITASTSVVLVPTSTGPFVVLFSSINATGRLITVRDNDGAASGANPITLSTLQGVTFSGVASNTIQINQPYGFVTFACQPNGAYSILNTFAFPAGSAAANISNLFASTIGINTNNVAGYVLNVNGTALIKDLNLSTTRVALGDGAGIYKNSNNTTAIGPFAGFSNQGDQGVAIGYYAGYSNQKASATALGPTSGLTNQGTEAVAVGFNAGRIDQGSNSIAIGSRAGLSAQPANSIVLNASGTTLNGASANSLFIRPIRDDLAGNGTPLYYNASTYEITRGPAPGSLSNFGDIYAYSTFTNYLSANIVAITTLSNAGSAVIQQNLIASSTFTNYLSSARIYTSSLGVGNNTPATNLVVDVATNNSLTGIAARSADVYTILGEEPAANHGSLQVTRLGTSSAIGTSPWNLSIQPRGGDTYIGSNNNAYTTTINGSFLVPGGNVGIRTGSASFPLDVNGQVRISSNGAYTNPLLNLSDNNQMNFLPNLGPGSFNNIISSNDSGIIFVGSGGTGTGNLAICPQATGPSGIKILSNGNVGIGKASPSRPLDVNGRVIISSNGAYTNSLLNLTDNNQINFYPNLGTGSYNSIVSSNDCGIIFTGAGGSGTGNLAICPQSGGTAGVKITSNGNVGINIASPATGLVVDVPTNNSLIGIAAQSAGVYTIIGNTPSDNNGSIQVTSGGSASAIGTTPYSLQIQPRGGITTIGSNNYANNTFIRGDLNVYGSNTGGILLSNENTDYRWRKNGVTTPGLLNYIPISYLTNSGGFGQLMMFPIVWTDNTWVNLPTDLQNKEDGIFIGPRVKVTLNTEDSGSGTSYEYSNVNTFGFVYYSFSVIDAINSYKSIFI